MPDPLLAGLPIRFPYRGKGYLVAPLTLEAEAAFAQAHADQAYRQLRGFVGILPAAVLANQLEGWRRDVFEGRFRFGGPLSLRYLASGPGAQLLAGVLISRGASRFGGPAVSRKTVARIHQDDRRGPELVGLLESLMDQGPAGAGDGPVLDNDELLAYLTVDCKIPWETLWQLTRRQIRAIWLRSRNKDGRLKLRSETVAPRSTAQELRDIYRALWWPKWLVDREVRKHLEEIRKGRDDAD